MTCHLPRLISFASSGVLAAALLSSVVGCSDMLTFSQDAQRQGIGLYNEGNYPDAAGAFRNSVKQDPRNYRSYYYLGASYVQIGQYQQAINAFKSALGIMDLTLDGRNDNAFRFRTIEGLSVAIAKSDMRNYELDAVEKQANANQNAGGFVLLGKIYRLSGDADTALLHYNRAMLLEPQNVFIVREYGLYLEQLGQTRRAEPLLRRAYTLDPKEPTVAAALRRIGVVPGPSIRDERDLAQPLMPKGPIPEVDLSKINPLRTQSADSSPNTVPTPRD